MLQGLFSASGCLNVCCRARCERSIRWCLQAAGRISMEYSLMLSWEFPHVTAEERGGKVHLFFHREWRRWQKQDSTATGGIPHPMPFWDMWQKKKVIGGRRWDIMRKLWREMKITPSTCRHCASCAWSCSDSRSSFIGSSLVLLKIKKCWCLCVQFLIIFCTFCGFCYL